MGLAARLGRRNFDWQNLMVRLVDAFTKKSIPEYFDALLAEHAKTHDAIPEAVAKFEGMVNRNADTTRQNQAVLTSIKEYHTRREARIDQLLENMQLLTEVQRELTQQLRSINQRLDTLEDFLDAQAPPHSDPK